ncbi:Uncharacterised protein [Anaerococcus prevotii]|uniref:DUF4355 domain-containing protein n=1 Tax=Anaerococcus prevotii (strain ATCC 9321 / DSM 20548 / JCM 6508 / NCTC 11806 / PC1) TaxID=525919 RepID=C7RHA6_ANAPD|nr:DUF4355 domain-containing protein [Anaerococcus prevotii]ACV28867.1 hypothetical protein Apre_0839 [Anaerococcus prevotii DSM 20548]SUU94540.1 Uncharacterised protein [Anaerococcus prevotii]
MKDLLIADIDLQRLSESEDTASEEQVQDEAQEEVDQEEKTYSQEEYDKAIEKATEGYVSQEKVQEIIDKTIAKERKKAEDAERLSKLSESERAKEQAKLDKEEIEGLRAKLARRDLEDDTKKELQDQDLDMDFMEFVIDEDAEKTLERIQRFKVLFDKAVNAGVEKRVVGRSPKGSDMTTAKKEKKQNMGDYAQTKRII